MHRPLNKDKDLVGLKVPLHLGEILWQQFVDVTQDRYAPCAVIDQRHIACAGVFADFKQRFWNGHVWLLLCQIVIYLFQ